HRMDHFVFETRIARRGESDHERGAIATSTPRDDRETFQARLDPTAERSPELSRSSAPHDAVIQYDVRTEVRADPPVRVGAIPTSPLHLVAAILSTPSPRRALVYLVYLVYGR